MRNRNYSLLKTLLLEEILDGQKTAEMSKHLGYSFDQYKRWLEDKKILRWDEFSVLAEKLNLDLKGANRLIWYDESSGENFFSYLKRYSAFKSIPELASYLSCHVSVVKRYLSGDTIPDLETILRLIDKNSNILSPYITTLLRGAVNGEELLKFLSDEMKSAVLFTSNVLTCSMIQAALDIPPEGRVGSTPEWLATHLNLPLAEIDTELQKMVDDGLLTFDGKDTYTQNNKTTNISGVPFRDSISYFQQLNELFIKLLEEKRHVENSTPKPGFVVSRIYSTSPSGAEKIKNIVVQAAHQILKTIEEDDQPATETFSLLIQSLPISNRDLPTDEQI